MENVYVGLDLGTSSVKACAFSRAGKLIQQCQEFYPLYHPTPGAAVQPPEVILAAAEKSLRDLLHQLPTKPRGIGISVAMHSVVLLDAQFAPLTPLITWADTRPSTILHQLNPDLAKALHRRTGTPIHPMSPLLKVRWLQEAQNPLWQRTHYVSDLKSYLVQQWTTDGLLLDKQLASATGWYAAKSEQWDEAAMSWSGITQSSLPKLVQPDHQLNWHPAVAERIGAKGVPLFIGGSDGCLANLSSNLTPGKVALTIGTSGAVRATHQLREVDPELGLFNYQLYDDFFVVGGPTNNGAKVMEWLFNLLGQPFGSIGAFIEAAANTPLDDLQFVPHIFGERAPIWDANATGSFSNIRGHHRAEHFARAALEGITVNIVEILRQLERTTGKSSQIVASGGFTASPFWLQLLREKAQREIIVADSAQASAFGAAMIVQLGLKEYASFPALLDQRSRTRT